MENGIFKYEIKAENASEATLSTIEKMQNRRRKPAAPGTISNLFDNTAPPYSWLLPGWVAEERIVPSGRLYKYYYDPSGKLYNRRHKVIATMKHPEIIIID